MRHRLFLAVGLVLVVGLGLGVLGASSRASDPEYQGKPLSAWLAELDREPGQLLTPDLLTRHKDAVEAIRQIGTNGLPLLVEWATAKRSWILAASESNMQRHERRLRRGFMGLYVLGPAAAPAVPQLAAMLSDPMGGVDAAACLALTGPSSVPLLTNVLGGSNPYARDYAMRVVGNLGSLAPDAVPMLLAIARSPVDPLAGTALCTLAEVSQDPAQHVPLFTEKLADPRVAADAAFALGRTAPKGFEPLIAATTNQSVPLQAAAIAALALQVRDTRPGRATNPPDWPFHKVLARYRWETDLLVSADGQRHRGAMAAWRLTRLLHEPDPSLHFKVVQALEPYGIDSVPGWSLAATDADEAVRMVAKAQLARLPFQVREGAIIRGPQNAKKIALVFTGHEYAEGAETILNELAKHNGKGSFFFTGVFVDNPRFEPLLERLVEEGHYVGPHSDRHLLYCPWEGPKTNLLTRQEFETDLEANCAKIAKKGLGTVRYFLPAFEHYNQQIAEWTKGLGGLVLVNYTPGTRSNGDYTGEADRNFISTKTIYDSIIAREQQGANGLNGYLLLLHIGSGPGRQDKFHARFGELLDYLAGKGYQFVRLDELLEPGAAANYQIPADTRKMMKEFKFRGPTDTPLLRRWD
jgi:peptidoglycan/xylan/chitin deacetylase (PgdA/CDA1 family)